MAIYHFHAQVISRSDGRSAVAAAAYRSGTVLIDPFGETFDYSKKQGVTDTRIFVPDGCPTIERQKLWRLAEQTDKRKNSCLAREADIALPLELTRGEKIQVAAQFSRWLSREYGVAVDCCHHAGGKNDEHENPHIHVMWTTRRYLPDGNLGAKTRELDDLKTRKEHLKRIRCKWAEVCNEFLQKYGTSIDARSFEEQGIERLPQIHVGPAASAMERRGIDTDRGSLNRSIIEFNEEMQKLEMEESNDAEQFQTEDMGRLREQSDAVHEAMDRGVREKVSHTEDGQRLEPCPEGAGYGTPGTAGSQKASAGGEQWRSPAVQGSAGTPGPSLGSGRGSRPAEDGRGLNDERPIDGIERLAGAIRQDCSGIKKAMHKRIVAANRRLIHNKWINAKLSHLECKSKLISEDITVLLHNIRFMVQKRNNTYFNHRKHVSVQKQKMDDLLSGIKSECLDIKKQIRNRIMKANRSNIMENNHRNRTRSLDWKLESIQQVASSFSDAKYDSVDEIDAAYMDEWLEEHLPIQPVIDMTRTQHLAP